MRRFWIPFFIITHVLCGLFQPVLSVQAPIEISETARNGTLIHTFTPDSENCTITTTPFLKDAYFTFDETNTSVNMVLVKPLDLEVLVEFKEDPAILTVNYSCTTGGGMLRIHIIPENEFDPIFLNSPYQSRVIENERSETDILNLRGLCRDEDRLQYGNITDFQLHPYQITAFDGRRYVNLDAKTGRLTTAIAIDFDVLPRNFFMLNISVTDDGGRSSLTSVNVSVVDVDDNPPYFTSCRDARFCHVTSYSAVIDRHFQGVPTITPADIHAVDGDRGINANIKYSIESDNVLSGNLNIDEKTGEISVLKPFSNYTNFTDFTRYTVAINITVVEDTTLKRSSQIGFELTVYYEFPTTPVTFPQTTTETPEEEHFDYTFVIEIAVPAFIVVVALIIIIIIVVRKKRKVARETRYFVREKEREKTRNPAEQEISTIDVLSSTPINPYELSSVYARISTGSGYEMVDFARDQTGSEQNRMASAMARINNEADMDAADTNHDNEWGDGSESNPKNLYAVVKKPKTRANNALDRFVNTPPEEVYAPGGQDAKTGEEEVESDTSCRSVESNGEFGNYDVSEMPPELCGEGEVMY